MENDDLLHAKDGGIERLLYIMRRLRDPDTGCPWDIEQSFSSIAPYTIEEAYEVADAIARGDMADLKGELGDLLLQTVYHTTIGEEEGLFTFHSVADAISDKMVARHPHVFGDQSRDKTADQQTIDWETIKAAERAQADQTRALDGVALGLPALTRAVKLQKRAARVGFDWPDVEQRVHSFRARVDGISIRVADTFPGEQRSTRERLGKGQSPLFVGGVVGHGLDGRIAARRHHQRRGQGS